MPTCRLHILFAFSYFRAFAFSIGTLGAIAAGLLNGCRHAVVPPVARTRFQDVTGRAGIHFERFNGAFGRRWMPETMGGGGGFIDYDGDGWPDVVLVNGDWWPGHPDRGPRPTLALYRNNGNGTFSDATAAAGLAVSLQGMGVAVGDYDNDGFDDLFVTAAGASRLFHNQPAPAGGRRFVDVTKSMGPADRGWSTSAAWFDYDGDGRLDLFVCHYVQWSPQTDIYCGTTTKAYCRPQEYPGEACRLYRNEGSRFTDVSQRAGIANPNGKSLGVCVCDLGGGGRPDLLVSNDTEPNFCYRNNGNSTFTDVALPAGLAVAENGSARAGMGIDCAAYSADGAIGIAVGNFNLEGIGFWRAAGSPPYEEVSRRVGVYLPSYPYVTFGLLFADFDNDGFPDLFATNGHIEDTVAQTSPAQTYPQPSLLFHNNGRGGFDDVSRAAGAAITQPRVGRGAAWGDFDNDGRPDLLLVPNTGPAALLRNDSEGGNHWLTLRLAGTRSNRDGLGASVRVRAGSATRVGYLHSGSSYLSASGLRLHFGLGTARQADEIEIRWPNGKRELLRDVPGDRIYRIVEGSGRAEPLPAGPGRK